MIDSTKSNELVFIKTESSKDFFARGKHIATLLDKGEKIDSNKMISFENTNDLIQFIKTLRQH